MADGRSAEERRLTRRDQNRPNRDEFADAKNHADNVLGLDEKVSDGLRRALKRFQNSPLTLMMEILNDAEQPWPRREDAAFKAFPYLHRKLEDKHGSQQAAPGAGAGAAGNAPTGPTINLTVTRPSVTVNERQSEAKPDNKAHASEVPMPKKPADKPRAFKRPKRVAPK